MRPKRALNIFGNNGWGGGAYLACEVAKDLLSKGWQVDFLSTDAQANAKFREIDGVRVLEHIDLPRDIRPIAQLRSFFKLRKFLKKAKYDVVQTFNSAPSVVGRFAAKSVGVKTILHHQAGWNSPYAGVVMAPVYKRIESASSKAATYALCCGNAEHDTGIELGIPSTKLKVIRNGIDLAPFTNTELLEKGKELRHDLGYSPQDRLFVSTCRLSSIKDIPTMLKAFRLVVNERADSHLLIAGSGPEEANIRSLTSELGLQDRVKLLGAMPSVLPLLFAGDVFITTTIREGLSISIIEALAAGLPVVASDIPANRELIAPEATGLLCAVGDSDSFAEAMISLAANPQLGRAIGVRAKRFAHQEFDITRFVNETVAVYENRAA